MYPICEWGKNIGSFPKARPHNKSFPTYTKQYVYFGDV